MHIPLGHTPKAEWKWIFLRVHAGSVRPDLRAHLGYRFAQWVDVHSDRSRQWNECVRSGEVDANWAGPSWEQSKLLMKNDRMAGNTLLADKLAGYANH